jgi:mercuric ion transport protein
MNWSSRLFDKAGALGTLIAAMGCATCFPAPGSFAPAPGIGILARQVSPAHLCPVPFLGV